MGSPVMRRSTTPVASHRSGVITGWSIVGILAACLCTGLAINYLHITLVRNDALRCAEASALAAGHQLISDETLRRNQHAFEYDGRISAGRARALTTAAEYQAHSFCPPLAAHQVLFETPFEKQGIRLSADQQTVPDRVIVSWARSTDVSRIPLFMAGLFGRRDAAVDIEAIAAVENCPVALVPSDSTAVPAIPFAIPDLPNDQSGNSWNAMIECGRGKDEYSWNPERRIVEKGPDGLPEMTLTLNLDDAARSCGVLVPVRLSQGIDECKVLCQLTREGIGRSDLTSVQLIDIQFPQEVQNPVLQGTKSKHSVRSISDALSSRVGKPVICFLTDTSQDDQSDVDQSDVDRSSSDEVEQGQTRTSRSTSISPVSKANKQAGKQSLCVLQRPVGVRILRVTQSTPDQVQVTLQPCVVVTSTARMDDAGFTARNRYVYAVRLVR